MYLWTIARPPLFGAIGAIGKSRLELIRVSLLSGCLVGRCPKPITTNKRRADNGWTTILHFPYCSRLIEDSSQPYSWEKAFLASTWVVARGVISWSGEFGPIKIPNLVSHLLWPLPPRQNTWTERTCDLKWWSLFFSSPLQLSRNLRSGSGWTFRNYRKFGSILSPFPVGIIRQCASMWNLPWKSILCCKWSSLGLKFCRL